MNKLQFGIDIGRALGSIEQVQTSDDVGAAAQRIINALELGIIVDEEPALLLGIGFGLADRHATPLDSAALELMGKIKMKEEGEKGG